MCNNQVPDRHLGISPRISTWEYSSRESKGGFSIVIHDGSTLDNTPLPEAVDEMQAALQFSLFFEKGDFLASLFLNSGDCFSAAPWMSKPLTNIRPELVMSLMLQTLRGP